MFKTLSTLLLVFCVVWLGYVFFKKSLALTNIHVFELFGWAWSGHPKGKMLVSVFALMFLTAVVLLLTTTQKALTLLSGKPTVLVYAGDELLNRHQRFYRADDSERRIVRVAGSAGSRLRFSTPTTLDTLLSRQLFLAHGGTPPQFSHLSDVGVGAMVVSSVFFYFSFALCIVILHTVARDYMQLEPRTVTPMDTVGEFIVVLSVLLVCNGLLLAVQYSGSKLKLGQFAPEELHAAESLPYQPGDRIQARVLEHSVLGNTDKGSGLVGDRAAYFLVEWRSPQGVMMTATFQFGYGSRQQPIVEAFINTVANNPTLDCEVTQRMTLRPVALLSSPLNWFED